MIEDSEKFYQKLAPYYDEMTRFKERIEKEEEVLALWRNRFNFSKILDVACGTGLHAILFASMGIEVVAADISREMLEIAKKNSNVASVHVEWIHSSIQRLTKNISKKFDAIFCLGNSLPHLLTMEDSRSAVFNFYHLLKSYGILVIQILNYQQILEHNKRIVGIHKQGSKEFIRFYDLLEDIVRFNVLAIEWNRKEPKHWLNSTYLYPYTIKEISGILEQTGFNKIEFFGDLRFSPFRPNDSPNLVVVAHKHEKRI